MTTLTAAAILDALDEAQQDELVLSIAGLDWKYTGARLHLFGDGRRRWALILEELSYPFAPRSGRYPEDTFYLMLHCAGNAIRGGARTHFLEPVRRVGTQPICYADEAIGTSYRAQRLCPETKRLRLHGHTVRVPHDAAAYRACGLRPAVLPSILKFELAVWLVETHRERMFATAAELRTRLTMKLPELLRSDAWHQPTLFGEPPSATPTYQMLADVLASGDRTRFRPRLRPNTHWKQQRG